jgi:hypothetical protein
LPDVCVVASSGAAVVRVRKKTFSGRPRKSGPREPNGKPQRRPKQEIEADVIAIALAQPHRRGDRDQRRSTFIGRALLDGLIRCGDLEPSTLVLACDHYQRDYDRWRGAVESRRPLAVTGGRPQRPEPKTPEEWEKAAEEYRSAAAAWAAVNRSLRDCGVRTEQAMAEAILFAPPDASHETGLAPWLAPWIILELRAGVAQLVKHYRLK